MGSSLFARHYSGSRGFFPFLRVLRCFSSPACLLLPYGFRQGYARITTRGFPHSDIPGSRVGQHLPGAFRSRPRPSSALGAKASTVCPCSLDQKEHVLPLWSFQGTRGPLRPPHRRPPSRPVPQSSAAHARVPRDDGPTRSTLFQASGVIRTVETIDGHHGPPETSSGIPRKEVIQPHLPVRLPCYDFTPIIDPTFDGCLLLRG